MEQIVSEYEIPPALSGAFWKKVVLFLSITGFAFVFRWAINLLFGWKDASFSYQLIMAAALGAVLTFGRLRVTRRATLTLGDGFIEARTDMQWFKVRKRIERTAIRHIKEGPSGIAIMDRGEFGARMLGFIYVPIRLPQYQQVRSRLAHWHHIERRSWG
ncbi:MAG TPA: hypothetical protein VE783_10695 [Candidatus Limnocylindrales bacterium]|jgi:hypothetical protein|nr:hypothetical protein [Candidatus Limnocylindrales bacterium]